MISHLKLSFLLLISGNGEGNNQNNELLAHIETQLLDQ
jgi:hypothetical protein